MIRDINGYIRIQRENGYREGVSNFDKSKKMVHSLYEDVVNILAMKVYSKDYELLNHSLTGEIVKTEVTKDNYEEMYNNLKEEILPKYIDVISKRLGYDEVMSHVNDGNNVLENINELGVEGLNVTEEDIENNTVYKSDLKYFSYGKHISEEDKVRENELKFVTNYYRDSEIELKVVEGGVVVIQEVEKEDNVIVINPLRLDTETIVDVILLDKKFNVELNLEEYINTLDYKGLVNHVYTLTADRDTQIEEYNKEYFLEEYAEDIEVLSEEEEVNLDFEWKLNNLKELESIKEEVDDNGEVLLNVLLKDKSKVEDNDRVILQMLDKMEKYTEVEEHRKEEFIKLNTHHVASVVVTISS